MSNGGRTMVSGNVLSANKGASADERTFTEQNEAVNAPTSFKEARTNLGIITAMVLNEHAWEDLLDT